MRDGLPRAVCVPAMTLRFTEVRCAAAHMGAALQGIFVGQGPCALPGSAGKLGSGRCRHRPLRKRISGCVGEGLSCPPSCQPTDGHCRARQSGHFLETGSLHPPLAALRRFPLPRATARVAPTEGYKGCGQNGPSGTPAPTKVLQGMRCKAGRAG